MASPAEVRRRNLFFLCLLAQRFTFGVPSIVSAGSSASRTAASEAAETSTAISSSVSASTAVTAASAAHEVSKQEEDEASVAGLDEEEQDQQDNAAAEDDFSEADLNGGRLAMILVDGLGDAQGYAGIVGDDTGYLLHA
jgi:hypothetical protein